jgi:hypothetical protein
MDKMLIKKGAFEATIQYNEALCNISLKIPRDGKDIDPNDFNHLIEYFMKLCLKKDENADVEVYINDVLQKTGEQVETTPAN